MYYNRSNNNNDKWKQNIRSLPSASIKTHPGSPALPLSALLQRGASTGQAGRALGWRGHWYVPLLLAVTPFALCSPRRLNKVRTLHPRGAAWRPHKRQGKKSNKRGQGRGHERLSTLPKPFYVPPQHEAEWAEGKEEEDDDDDLSQFYVLGREVEGQRWGRKKEKNHKGTLSLSPFRLISPSLLLYVSSIRFLDDIGKHIYKPWPGDDNLTPIINIPPKGIRR